MQNYRHDSGASQTTPAVQPIYVTNGGTAVVVIAMLLLTIIILYITSQNAESAPVGIVGSVAFFLVGTPIGLLAVNGGIATMFGDWQQQKTVREYNRMQLAPTQQLSVVEPVQLPYTEPMQLPASSSFVPAVPRTPDTIKLDAGNFVTQLFNSSNGRQLPAKITPHKRQIQHKSPSPEAVEYLESLGIVTRGEGKQLYWSPRYPTLRDALNAIRTGRRPSYQEDKGRVEGEGL